MSKNRAAQKLKSRSGETISELLIALLISSLALTMLAGMITAASRIVRNSMKSMENYVEQENGIVSRSDGGSPGTLTVRIDGSETARKLTDEDPNNYINVTFYRTDAFGKVPVITYERSETDAGATPGG
jgi:hypothetical protein